MEQAKTQVAVGRLYAHYKNPTHIVKVTELAFLEETEAVCVIYQETGDRPFRWIRPVSDFLAIVSWKGQTLHRFSPVENFA